MLLSLLWGGEVLARQASEEGNSVEMDRLIGDMLRWIR